jgi:hypothetical protein
MPRLGSDKLEYMNKKDHIYFWESEYESSNIFPSSFHCFIDPGAL